MKRHYYSDMILRAAITIVFAIVVLVFIASLFSCRTKKEATDHFRDAEEMVQTTKSDTVFVLAERTDSVVFRDSVFQLIKGDTVFIKEYHYRDNVKTKAEALYKASRDTVWRERTVTVYKTKTVTLEVKKPLRWWQSALMWTGAACIVLALVRIAGIISKYIKR